MCPPIQPHVSIKIQAHGRLDTLPAAPGNIQLSGLKEIPEIQQFISTPSNTVNPEAKRNR
jgi:hypothetical protein